PLYSSVFNPAAAPESYPLSLHDALPIWSAGVVEQDRRAAVGADDDVGPAVGVEIADRDRCGAAARCVAYRRGERAARGAEVEGQDRKSTRLNSSHLGISYAVFCLKKKKK